MSTKVKKEFFMISPSPYFKSKKLIVAVAFTVAFLCIILFLTIFFLEKEEKTPEAILMENIMIREGGIYTLIGSKPMTEFFLIDPKDVIPQTEAAMIKSYEELVATLRHGNEKKIPTYKEYKKDLKETMALQHLNNKKLWSAWKRSGRVILNQPYKLVVRKDIIEGEEVGLFVNVVNTEYILKKYYHSFKEGAGFDFCIKEVVEELNFSKSLFWEKVFKNHYLQGLLFGFGGRESFWFDWNERNLEHLEDVMCFGSTILAGFKEKAIAQSLYKKKITIKDLLIPSFTTVGVGSKTVEKFSKERMGIIKFLGDKDFIGFLNEHLKISPPIKKYPE